MTHKWLLLYQGNADWTHVKEKSVSESLEVFDVSRRGQARKIYSFGGFFWGRIILKIQLIIILGTGCGDATHNSRRGILGAIPVTKRIAYHLYDVATGKASNIVKLIRKSKWHSQYSTQDGILLKLLF